MTGSLVFWARQRLDVQLVGMIRSLSSSPDLDVVDVLFVPAAVGTDTPAGALVGALETVLGPARLADIALALSPLTTSAEIGAPVGTLETSDMDITFALTDDAGGKFSLTGAEVKVAGALSAGVSTIVVLATDENGWTRSFEYPIAVTQGGDPPDPSPSLKFNHPRNSQYIGQVI